MRRRDSICTPIPQPIDWEIQVASKRQLLAYLAGARRDGTVSERHNTVRISQKGTGWISVLLRIFERLGRRAWAYEEGHRGVWVIEATRTGLDVGVVEECERAAFVRGYFDAEGGVPQQPSARFYVQFVQRDRADLALVRQLMCTLDIMSGRLHNPSSRVDPHYWRFYVAASSHRRFIESVGSWHPRKRHLLKARLAVPGHVHLPDDPREAALITARHPSRPR
jgi:hypothetical protein